MQKIEIPIDKMRRKKLFVATPMYGGQCHGIYTRSVNDLTALCAKHQIELKFYYLFNESLITRARNYCCDEFLRSDCTHMIFIDSDIGFNPNDVITMLAMIDEEDDDCPYDILCGPYPKKCISWEKIVAAVDQGICDNNPATILEKFVGDYVFNPIGGRTQIKLDEPTEVLESGTGFMMFTKKTLERFAAAYPEMYYKPDHVRTANFDGSREIMAFFDALIDNKHAHVMRELPKFLDANPDATSEGIMNFLHQQKERVNSDEKEFSNRYLSEDYMFCQWAREAGLRVWLCPWMALIHCGSFVFGGSLVDLAQIGASATADPSKLGDKKTATM